MRLIEYEDFEPSSFASKIGNRMQYSMGSTGSGAVVAYAGLSPFDVPESIDFQIDPSDSFTVRFHYANEEPPEGPPRPIGADGVELQLGKNSKKILAVYFPHARNKLTNGLSFDMHGIFEVALELPLNTARACERNAALVNEILKATPYAWRRKILSAMDER